MYKINIITMVLIISVSFLSATSLWNNQNPYADNNAHKIGDIITIVINEASVGNTKSDMAREKELTIGGAPGNGQSKGTMLNKLARMIPLFGAEITGKSDVSTTSDQKKSSSLIATISVVVKSITAEGNLLLEGEKEVKINTEKQRIVIKGIARPDDVTSDNTIMSDKIANAEIMYTGKLSLSDKKHPGFLKRAVTSIFGFLF